MRQRSVRGAWSVVFVLWCASWNASGSQASDGDPLWDIDGEEIASGGAQVLASDGAGGAYIAWVGAGVFVQRLDASGTAQWPAPVQVSSTGSSPAIVAQILWGTTIAWEESNGIYVQRVSETGVRQWASGGVQVATSGSVPRIVHIPGPTLFDPPGALIAWGEAARVAAVDGTGVVTAPGVDGISLGGSVRRPGFMRMISDQAGGAIVVWADFAKDIVAQRVNAGLPWGATPTLVSNDARDEGPLDARPDGAGGALISWSAIRLLPANAQVRVQRIDSSGTSQWAPNGVVLVDSDDVGGNTSAWTSFEVASSVDTDGGGGAIVAWSDWRNETTIAGNDDIFAQRVSSGGIPVWAANGILLPPFISGSTAPGSQRRPELVSDGNGGAIVTYPDLGGNSWDISATRLDAFGTKLFSRYVFTDFQGTDVDQIEPRIVFDGSGPSPAGAIIAWEDDRSGLSIRAQKVEISGPINDDSADAIAVTAATFGGTLLGSSRDGNSGCDVSDLTTDVWYVFNPPEPGQLTVDTCGTHDLIGLDTGMDSVLSLHSGAPGTVGNEIVCNDDWISGGTPADRCLGVDGGLARDSTVSTLLTTTDPVWIRVSHYSGTPPYDFELNVEFVPEPGYESMLVCGVFGLAILCRRESRRARAPDRVTLP